MNITPEMIEAGRKASDPGDYDHDNFYRSIYEAMEKARPKPAGFGMACTVHFTELLTAIKQDQLAHQGNLDLGQAGPTLSDCIRRHVEAMLNMPNSMPNELTEEMLIAAQKADGDHGDAHFWREYGTGWRLRRMWSALVGTARGYHGGGIVPQKLDDDRDTMTFAECVDVLRGFRAKNTRLRNAIECLIPYLEKMGKTTLTWNDYQARVRLWMLHVFGGRVMRNVEERCDRFLEEVIELLQSLDYDPRRIPRLVSYVYNRPVGKKFQEAGGVSVTFSALCDAAEIDMADAGEVELQRVWDQRVIDKVRSKQQSKRDLHSPLPGREHAP